MPQVCTNKCDATTEHNLAPGKAHTSIMHHLGTASVLTECKETPDNRVALVSLLGTKRKETGTMHAEEYKCFPDTSRVHELMAAHL